MPGLWGGGYIVAEEMEWVLVEDSCTKLRYWPSPRDLSAEA